MSAIQRLEEILRIFAEEFPYRGKGTFWGISWGEEIDPVNRLKHFAQVHNLTAEFNGRR